MEHLELLGTILRIKSEKKICQCCRVEFSKRISNDYWSRFITIIVRMRCWAILFLSMEKNVYVSSGDQLHQMCRRSTSLTTVSVLTTLIIVTVKDECDTTGMIHERDICNWFWNWECLILRSCGCHWWQQPSWLRMERNFERQSTLLDYFAAIRAGVMTLVVSRTTATQPVRRLHSYGSPLQSEYDQVGIVPTSNEGTSDGSAALLDGLLRQCDL